VKKPLWLGLDIGTQSIKAVLINDSGKVIANAAAPLNSRREGVIHEQDSEQWWAATKDVIAKVVSKVKPENIKALSISSTSGSLVVVDSQGNAVSKGIMYDDARATHRAPECNEAGADLWDSLGYKVQGTWALPKILWLLDEGILFKGRKVIHQGDYIAWKLAGKEVDSDTSNTLKSGFDIEKVQWPSDLLKKLKIPREVLPNVSVAGQVIGVVSSVNETSLTSRTSIVAGMTDGCAAQIAAAALLPGSWNSVLGTTLVIKGASNVRKLDLTGSVYAHRAPFSTGWWPGGASNTGTNAIAQWLPGIAVSRLKFNNEELLAAPVIYPLCRAGERFPFVSNEAHALVAHGLKLPTLESDGAKITFASIVKGVAFVERLSFDLLAYVGYDISGSYTFTGGGANNAQWNQLRADVLCHSVLIPGEVEGAFGMAILAAAAFEDSVEELKLSSVAKRFLTPGLEIEPDLSNGKLLLTQYIEFIEMLHNKKWIATELKVFAVARAQI
jgi:sugar (pentulose or hexulose) kinase